MEFAQTAWAIINNLYTDVYSNGYQGSLIALVLGIFLLRWGDRLKGHGESFSGTVYNGYANLTRRPAREGTAKSWIGRLIGSLLSIGGLVLFLIAIVSFANIITS